MKTEHTRAPGSPQYTNKNIRGEEAKRKDIKEAERKDEPSYRTQPKKIDLKEPINNPLEAVKKMVDENIEWRQMRFYRHESDGQFYVDIINKETGEIIRTVPEPEFFKIATEFKHLTGMNLDISG